MKRPPAQASLGFTRQDKVRHRQWSERAQGKKVRRGPGRPKSKTSGVSHLKRPELAEKSAVHVTLKVRKHVPNLRSRRRFSVIKKAFVRFCTGQGFRLVRFSVLSNHMHFVLEADSKKALSLGMQKLSHSISRRLSALNVRENGGKVSTKAGKYTESKGWLGKVFADRYHAHVLKTPTEMQHAIRYVLQNAEHHHVYNVNAEIVDEFCSAAKGNVGLTTSPLGYLLRRACDAYPSMPRRTAK